MHEPRERVLLRIFIDENERFAHKPLYEAVVLKAREMKMAGATVLRASLGYGKSSVIHTSKILRLSTALPLVIEMVDKEEKIDAFLPVLDAMINSGLVTIEKVRVLHYGSKED
jgi:uncharacterized protein